MANGPLNLLNVLNLTQESYIKLDRLPAVRLPKAKAAKELEVVGFRLGLNSDKCHVGFDSFTKDPDASNEQKGNLLGHSYLDTIISLMTNFAPRSFKSAEISVHDNKLLIKQPVYDTLTSIQQFVTFGKVAGRHLFGGTPELASVPKSVPASAVSEFDYKDVAAWKVMYDDLIKAKEKDIAGVLKLFEKLEPEALHFLKQTDFKSSFAIDHTREVPLLFGRKIVLQEKGHEISIKQSDASHVLGFKVALKYLSDVLTENQAAPVGVLQAQIEIKSDKRDIKPIEESPYFAETIRKLREAATKLQKEDPIAQPLPEAQLPKTHHSTLLHTIHEALQNFFNNRHTGTFTFGFPKYFTDAAQKNTWFQHDREYDVRTEATNISVKQDKETNQYLLSFNKPLYMRSSVENMRHYFSIPAYIPDSVLDVLRKICFFNVDYLSIGQKNNSADKVYLYAHVRLFGLIPLSPVKIYSLSLQKNMINKYETMLSDEKLFADIANFLKSIEKKHSYLTDLLNQIEAHSDKELNLEAKEEIVLYNKHDKSIFVKPHIVYNKGTGIQLSCSVRIKTSTYVHHININLHYNFNEANAIKL